MAIKNKIDSFIEEYVNVKIEDAMGDRFGRYSKYIIQERAIPDVRDGLKPVQRRILYAMHQLGITHTSTYKKSAKICGEVMGKYHPHGDSSIYEAMVRMSQDWKMGVILIDMHGNNGSIDGDSPAAMRYTEARMSKNASFLLQDIEKNTVPFIPNFDEEEKEPVVLPSRFPNLLVNGSTGIASGYATNIPTHNFNEVIKACIYRIDHPNMNLEELLEIMPGPDFPTGGIVQGKDGIKEAFLTGIGQIYIRSKFIIEDISKTEKRIVFTEIPYDTNKAEIVEKIDQLRLQNKIQDLVEVRDESDREGLRIALDLKKDANIEAITNYLFKNTNLQISYKYNMISICNHRPMQLGVIDILDAYILHQKEIITNRTNFNLEKAKKRLHIVEGLIRMVSILDEVIKTIRESINKADSKNNLINKFEFTELQAEAIVTMQLYRLSNTDILALSEEVISLKNNIEEFEKILSSEKELLKVIKKELDEINKSITIPRKTIIEDKVSDLKVNDEELISQEECYIFFTKQGYIKRVSVKNYNMSKVCALKENDSVIFEFLTNTLNKMLVFTNMGNYLYIPIYKIPECKLKDPGIFVNSIVNVDPKEQFISYIDVSDFNTNKEVLFTLSDGSIKRMPLSILDISRYSKAVRCVKITEKDEVVSVDFTDNPMEIMLITKLGEALRFRATDLQVRDTTQSGTVRCINLKDKDMCIKGLYTNKELDLLLLTDKSYIKRMKVSEVNLSRRNRQTQDICKKIKSNPIILKDAQTMSQLQYKENVLSYISYKNGNNYINVNEYKYNVSEQGKQFLKDDLIEPFKLFVYKSEKEEPIVSNEYLIEEKQIKQTLFGDVQENDDLLSKKYTSNEHIKKEENEIKLAQSLLSKIDSVLNESKKKKDINIINSSIHSLFDDNDDISDNNNFSNSNNIKTIENTISKEDNLLKIEEDDKNITKTYSGSIIIKKKKI